ncbi:Uu.00g132790.m01.CDS01 [Anthostomella pinea]|uniref:Uu.00g132790.m01.CDS01 n=1 Tax=Anthostomella pinea TaxID=933095 RepID=A0AAI8VTR5_9PEZI|nr:Uu.00g132790.m01.CDS01 [Anthostomella pinea]
MALMPALPQLVLAILYLTINSLLTTSFPSHETALFAMGSRALRVSSNPSGRQPTSLYLTLPPPVWWMLLAASNYELDHSIRNSLLCSHIDTYNFCSHSQSTTSELPTLDYRPRLPIRKRLPIMSSYLSREKRARASSTSSSSTFRQDQSPRQQPYRGSVLDGAGDPLESISSLFDTSMLDPDGTNAKIAEAAKAGLDDFDHTPLDDTSALWGEGAGQIHDNESAEASTVGSLAGEYGSEEDEEEEDAGQFFAAEAAEAGYGGQPNDLQGAQQGTRASEHGQGEGPAHVYEKEQATGGQYDGQATIDPRILSLHSGQNTFDTGLNQAGSIYNIGDPPSNAAESSTAHHELTRQAAGEPGQSEERVPRAPGEDPSSVVLAASSANAAPPSSIESFVPGTYYPVLSRVQYELWCPNCQQVKYNDQF